MFSKLCETAKGIFAQLSPSQAIRQSASEKDPSTTKSKQRSSDCGTTTKTAKPMFTSRLKKCSVLTVPSYKFLVKQKTNFDFLCATSPE